MATKEELEQEIEQLRAQLDAAGSKGDRAAEADLMAALTAQSKAFEAITARDRALALNLPSVRLDEAGPGYHFVVRDQQVDHSGQPVKPRGPYLRGEAED